MRHRLATRASSSAATMWRARSRWPPVDPSSGALRDGGSHGALRRRRLSSPALPCRVWGAGRTRIRRRAAPAPTPARSTTPSRGSSARWACGSSARPGSESRSRAEVRAFLEKQFATSHAVRDLAGTEIAYKLFGLLPDTMHLRAELEDLAHRADRRLLRPEDQGALRRRRSAVHRGRAWSSRTSSCTRCRTST